MIYSLKHLWIYVFSHIHITFKSTVSINSNNSNNTGFFLPAVQWIFNSLPVFYSRPSQSLYFPFVYTCVLDWKIIVQPLKLTCILKMFKCHFFNIYKWHTSGMSTDNGGFVGLRHIKINSPPTQSSFESKLQYYHLPWFFHAKKKNRLAIVVSHTVWKCCMI